ADGRIAVAPGCPDEVGAFADQMLADVPWRPDELFMMDLCESRDGLWLVELNSFSCSALYQCDPKVVVSTASEFAVRAWERHQREKETGSVNRNLSPEGHARCEPPRPSRCLSSGEVSTDRP